MSVNLHQALQDATCHLASHEDSEDQESTTVEQEQWVSLDLKLLDWSFFDLKMTVTLETKVMDIVRALQSHHGGKMNNLVLYNSEVRETTEMNEWGETLKDYGLNGSFVKDDAPSVTIYYNFTPNESQDVTDPILLSWN